MERGATLSACVGRKIRETGGGNRGTALLGPNDSNVRLYENSNYSTEHNYPKGVRENMKFLVDAGAELCLCKYSSNREGIVYVTRKILNVMGISDSEKTLGELGIFRA